MYHLKERTTAQIEVKKSRFICVLTPIQEEAQIKEIIAELKKLYPSATHYCYGCALSGLTRSNDDGEPSSTAGKPILNQLLTHQLDNVLAVVIRYFGGTLLGTAGLIRAYGDAAAKAIESATLTEPVVMNLYEVRADYAFMSKIEFVLAKHGEIIERSYEGGLVYRFLSEEDCSDVLLEATNGQAEIRYLEQRTVEKSL